MFKSYIQLKICKEIFNKIKEFVSVVNIDKIFKRSNNTSVGLAGIVHAEYGKYFSKYNQESGWSRRPLRKGQLHYAILDAVAALQILLRVRKRGGEALQLVRLFLSILKRT